MKKVYCEGRKIWVAATPEELVRQRLLHHLTHDLLFPSEGIALEKSLSEMPHLNLLNEAIPNRRIDITCYAKDIHHTHASYPLLIIECKAVKLTDPMMAQAVGYNYFAKSYFLALANATEIRFQFYDPKTGFYSIIPYIPPYQELLSFVRQ